MRLLTIGLTSTALLLSACNSDNTAPGDLTDGHGTFPVENITHIACARPNSALVPNTPLDERRHIRIDSRVQRLAAVDAVLANQPNNPQLLREVNEALIPVELELHRFFVLLSAIEETSCNDSYFDADQCNQDIPLLSFKRQTELGENRSYTTRATSNMAGAEYDITQTGHLSHRNNYQVVDHLRDDERYEFSRQTNGTERITYFGRDLSWTLEEQADCSGSLTYANEELLRWTYTAGGALEHLFFKNISLQ